jgi:hypothetical protein
MSCDLLTTLAFSSTSPVIRKQRWLTSTCLPEQPAHLDNSTGWEITGWLEYGVGLYWVNLWPLEWPSWGGVGKEGPDAWVNKVSVQRKGAAMVVDAVSSHGRMPAWGYMGLGQGSMVRWRGRGHVGGRRWGHHLPFFPVVNHREISLRLSSSQTYKTTPAWYWDQIWFMQIIVFVLSFFNPFDWRKNFLEGQRRQPHVPQPPHRLVWSAPCPYPCLGPGPLGFCGWLNWSVLKINS